MNPPVEVIDVMIDPTTGTVRVALSGGVNYVGHLSAERLEVLRAQFDGRPSETTHVGVLDRRLTEVERTLARVDSDLHIPYDDRLKRVEEAVDSIEQHVTGLKAGFASQTRGATAQTARIDRLEQDRLEPVERQVADLMAKWAEGQHAEGIDDPDTWALLAQLAGKLIK